MQKSIQRDCKLAQHIRDTGPSNSEQWRECERKEYGRNGTDNGRQEIGAMTTTCIQDCSCEQHRRRRRYHIKGDPLESMHCFLKLKTQQPWDDDRSGYDTAYSQRNSKPC